MLLLRSSGPSVGPTTAHRSWLGRLNAGLARATRARTKDGKRRAEDPVWYGTSDTSSTTPGWPWCPRKGNYSIGSRTASARPTFVGRSPASARAEAGCLRISIRSKPAPRPSMKSDAVHTHEHTEPAARLPTGWGEAGDFGAGELRGHTTSPSWPPEAPSRKSTLSLLDRCGMPTRFCARRGTMLAGSGDGVLLPEQRRDCRAVRPGIGTGWGGSRSSTGTSNTATGRRQCFTMTHRCFSFRSIKTTGVPAELGPRRRTGDRGGVRFTINAAPSWHWQRGLYVCRRPRRCTGDSVIRPDFILVSAGQDPSAVDPLARMAMSADGFRRMASRVADLADELGGSRLAALHEGGYSEGYAPVCTCAVVEGLCDIRTGHEDPYVSWLGEVDPNREIGRAAAAIE